VWRQLSDGTGTARTIDAILAVAPIRKQLHAADSDPRDRIVQPRGRYSTSRTGSKCRQLSDAARHARVAAFD